MKEKTIFKSTVPMKGIIRVDEPDKTDLLDSQLLKEMTVDELNLLLLALPKWSSAYIRTHMEIEVREYSGLIRSRIKSDIVQMENVLGLEMPISNIDIEKNERRKNHTLKSNKTIH